MAIEYRYDITLQFMQNIKAKPKTIFKHSLRSLYIAYDYDNKNRPIVVAKLQIDKNMNDLLVANVKDGLIYMVITKIALDINTKKTQESGYISAICNYFVTSDFNPNRDIDYNKNDPNQHKLITQEISLGLMVKRTIDENRHTTNCTLTDTRIIDVVHEFTKHIPILIEPFTYNNRIKQLIVPPLDSVVKILHFLNGIKVFYNTPYRFFSDFDCAYLLSNSGKGTKKKGELSATVLIDIKRPTDPGAMARGTTYLRDKQCYYMVVLANGSKYIKNTVTNKEFTSILGILDNSRKYGTTLIGQIQGLFKSISGVQDKVVNIIKDNTPKINDLYSWANELHVNNKELIKQICAALPCFNSTGGSTEDKIMSKLLMKYPLGEYIWDWMGTFATYKKLKELRMKMQPFPGKTGPYGNSNVNTFGSMLQASILNANVNTFVTGICGINMGDNSHLATKQVSTVAPVVDKNANNASDVVAKEKNLVKIRELVKEYDSLCLSYPKKVTVIPVADPEHPKKVDTSWISGAGMTLKEPTTLVTDCANQCDANVADCNLQSEICKTIHTDLQNATTQLEEIPKDLRKQYLAIGTGAKNFMNTMRSEMQSLESSIQSLGHMDFGNIANLEKNISTIGDITGIGKTGIDKLEIPVNVNKSDLDFKKLLPIRIPDDNPNLLKNIKYQFESHASILKVSKSNIDTSIFTPNKEYLVHNYDDRTDENGQFILSNKIDQYIYDGDNFTLNTQLTFREVPKGAKDDTENLDHDDPLSGTANNNPLILH